MMNLLKIILILFLSTFFTTAFSQEGNKKNVDNMKDPDFVMSKQSDFLVPPESQLNSFPYRIKYNQKISEVLFQGLPKYFDLKYLSKPSFDTEELLVIYGHKLYYRKAKKSIWNTFYNEIKDTTNTVQLNSKRVKIKKHTNKISVEDTQLLNKLYRVAMAKTRYLIYTPDQLENLIIGTDGINYSFSLNNNGVMEGNTWSPEKGSKMYRLVEIHEKLIGIILKTKSNNEIVLPNQLKNKIKELIKHIEK